MTLEFWNCSRVKGNKKRRGKRRKKKKVVMSRERGGGFFGCRLMTMKWDFGVSVSVSWSEGERCGGGASAAGQRQSVAVSGQSVSSQAL